MKLPLTELKEAKMKSNVGGLDRVVRIVAGLGLVALAATGTVGMWGYIGIVPILTGTFKFCPAYTLLGMNTCPVNTK
jgi:NADH:ubiquinone oxidoreductase subunit 4 (subunit M)